MKDVVTMVQETVPDLDRLLDRLERRPESIIPDDLRSRAIVISDEDTALRVGGRQGSDELGYAEEEQRLMSNMASAARKIREHGSDAVLTKEEKLGAEAIVELVGRPPLLVQNGTFRQPPPEWEVLSQKRERINRTLPSVGRIELRGRAAPKSRVGTGFVAGPGIIMTNCHVAKEFCDIAVDSERKRTGDGEIKANMDPSIDFLEEYEGTGSSDYEITELIGVHKEQDIALFRVAATSRQGKALPPPLRIESQNRSLASGSQVYVVGYPAIDPRNDVPTMYRMFEGIFEVKRLQPGNIMAELNPEGIFLHDCSTLGGNSGSPVISLDTYRVIGLHYYGEYRVENRAVTLWKLKNDPLLKGAGVSFV